MPQYYHYHIFKVLKRLTMVIVDKTQILVGLANAELYVVDFEDQEIETDVLI